MAKRITLTEDQKKKYVEMAKCCLDDIEEEGLDRNDPAVKEEAVICAAQRLGLPSDKKTVKLIEAQLS